MKVLYCWGCGEWITDDDIETVVIEEETIDCPAVTEDVHMNCGSDGYEEIFFESTEDFKKWLNDRGVTPTA